MKEQKNNQESPSFWSYLSFGLGSFGESAVYMTFGTYLMVYVTTAMFSGIPTSQANKSIAMITSLVFIIRIVEIFIDPIIGNIVDNTHTRWGKFKPWLVGAGTISALLLILLFTGVFGLSRSNSTWFAILFIPTFVLFDIFYSFRDVSNWGMIPALSEDSHERSIYTAFANVGSSGQNVVTMIVVPVVTYFTYLATGNHTEGQSGWTVFSIIIAATAILCSFIIAFGTHEKQNGIRKVEKQKTSNKDMIKGLIHNDQMLWTALPYLVYGFGNAATSGLMFYLFKYVMDKTELFWITGMIPTIAGFITSPLYPIINKYISRKTIYAVSMCAMILAYFLLFISTDSLPIVITAMILYYAPQGFIFMAVILTLTDTVEYGQLKNGTRNEAVTLTLRPMLDKFSSAISNGIIGWVAVAAGMTGTATAASITPHGILIFKSVAFGAGLILHVAALLIYMFKVTLSEKKHAEIVDELQRKLATEGIGTATTEVSGETIRPAQPISNTETIIFSPVKGTQVDLSEIQDENRQKLASYSKGLGIYPSESKICAPFDGTVILTFTTKHVIGLRSDTGVDLLIHVGLGTVNLRGEGFITHFIEGQHVKKGELLLEFDRDKIQQTGYKDTILILFTQGNKIPEIGTVAKKNVQNGEKILTVKIK